jgi:hypothetical protein
MQNFAQQVLGQRQAVKPIKYNNTELHTYFLDKGQKPRNLECIHNRLEAFIKSYRAATIKVKHWNGYGFKSDAHECR